MHNLTCPDLTCPNFTCPDLTCPDLTHPDLTCPNLKCPALTFEFSRNRVLNLHSLKILTFLDPNQTPYVYLKATILSTSVHFQDTLPTDSLQTFTKFIHIFELGGEWMASGP